MLSKLKAHWPVAALILVSIILSIANYTPGTFLSGWDTLHPEFNFGLNFERTIFGVFRIEQGLGAVAGHSHMADLPRIILLYISHFIIPLSFLRYFYIFLCVILGTLGMYFLLKRHFLKQNSASFLGALFYLLNIGTVQTFNVPFEMFTTLFATTPFMFYFATSYLLEKENRTKNLLLFAVSVIFASPSAYAATLWYVFFLCFLIYFFFLSVVNLKNDKKSFKHFIILVLTTLVLNLFWIVPNVYFVLTHANEVAKANINRLFSDQAFLKNKEFGNLGDILFLKSFYFDWNIYEDTKRFTDLLSPWINHFKDIKAAVIGLFFGLSFILGGFYSFKKLKLKAGPLFLVLLFSLFFLINDNPPFSPIFNFFQNHVPFFKEALRFPSDKIFNVYVFLVSIFFGFAMLFGIENLKKLKVLPAGRQVKSEAVFVLIISVLIFYYALPSFKGNFINNYMRVDIPKSYFALFDYLKKEPDTLRVANLPIQSPYGWVYYNWYDEKPSFQGAGFLYFGIKQPLLDRDFDRWSPYNESYYREMSYAIYKQDKNLLSNVINKYKIGFILLDKGVSDPQNPKSILYFDESKKLIRDTGLVSEEKIFDKIEIFKLKKALDIVSALNTNVNVNPSTTTTYNDLAFDSYKNYITAPSPTGFSESFFPFRDLIDNQSKLHKNLLKIDNEKITLVPPKTIKNFATETLTKNINLIPSDLIVQKATDKLMLSIYPNTPVFDETPSSSPIKTTINTLGRKNISLSVNQKEFFNLNSVPQNIPIVVGKILFNNGQNTISAFDTSLLTPIKGGLFSFNPFFSSCSGENPPITGFTESGIKITGKGDICILIPYKSLSSYIKGPASSVLTDLRFNFNSDAKITSCLMDLVDLNCIYYSEPKRLGNLVSLSYVQSFGQLANTAIKIFIEPQNNNVNTYNLQNTNFLYTEAFLSLAFSKNDVEKIFTNSKNFSFDKIYLSKNVIYDPGFDITKTDNFQSGCPSPTSNVKKEIVTESGKKVIRYYSLTGSFCDHFSYPNLTHNQGYLITVYSKNKLGLPISICINNNTTQKCDIYSDLGAFKSFDKDTFLLPPMNDKGIGYNINLENIGINKSPAQNYISSIEFIPIPYEFLQNIQVKTQSPNRFEGKIEKITKYNPSLYLIDTNGKPTILSLNLSFERGFKAYYINCSNSLSCFLKANLAPFSGKEIKEHVLVNNWANGWVLQNSSIRQAQDKSQNSRLPKPGTGGQAKVAIIFLPQYFEYLGFVILILILGILSFRTINKIKE